MAVTTDTRRTGTQLFVYDDHLNDWLDLAGQDINVPVAYQYPTGSGPDEWEQGWWGYRGQASLCKVLDGSMLVRVRIGDGTDADRTIYNQEITDPTDPAQWTAWTQLYTGDHYAVAVEATGGAGYRVISAKSDALYVDNVSAVPVGTGYCVRIKPVVFWPGAIYYQVVSQDPDGERALEWRFCADVTAPTGTNQIEDAANYRWSRSDLAAILHQYPATPDKVYVLRALAETQARNRHASESLVMTNKERNGDTGHVEWDNADYIKGPSGQAGFRVMENLYLNKSGATDGSTTTTYYWAVWTEEHHTVGGESLSNLANPCFWMRTFVEPYDWSAPVPVGYSIWGLAGMVEFGNFMYLAGNGRVLQRPNAVTSDELSDYVLDGNYSLPRDTQPGTGTITLANAANAVGETLGLISTSDAGLTHRRIGLWLGLKRELDADWTWKNDGMAWITNLAKNADDDKHHVVMSVGDFRAHMDTPFLEAINIPGRLHWIDWQVGGSNDRTNGYHNDDHEFYAVAFDGSVGLLTTAGDTVWTGWRGENGSVFAKFSTRLGRLVFRWQDKDNYWSVERDLEDRIHLYQAANGVKIRLATAAVSNTLGFLMEVDFRWNRIRVIYNYTQVLDYRPITPNPVVGFVGVGSADGGQFTVGSFQFHEWNRRYTTIELLARLVAYAGTPDWAYGSGSSPELFAEQLDMMWGPQSDLKTPGQAFDTYLSAGKLQARYNNAVVEFGHFDAVEADVEDTIDNEIIAQEHTSEGERPNVVSVDGQINSWVEYDRADLLQREVIVPKYLDLPELNTPGDVRTRAEREVLDARRFNSPGGDVVWFPQWSRLHPYFWIDEDNLRFLTRIEGMRVEWNQGPEPFQRAHLDMGTLVYCPPTTTPGTYLARDTYQRTLTSDWGNAQVGGNWIVT